MRHMEETTRRYQEMIRDLSSQRDAMSNAVKKGKGDVISELGRRLYGRSDISESEFVCHTENLIISNCDIDNFISLIEKELPPKGVRYTKEELIAEITKSLTELGVTRNYLNKGFSDVYTYIRMAKDIVLKYREDNLIYKSMIKKARSSLDDIPNSSENVRIPEKPTFTDLTNHEFEMDKSLSNYQNVSFDDFLISDYNDGEFDKLLENLEKGENNIVNMEVL